MVALASVKKGGVYIFYTLVILLAGGTKKRQDADIAAAKGHWRDYKRRKRQEVT